MPVVSLQDFFNGRLKLRHLVVALSVLEEGSTVAAAQRLFVSQPAITRSINDLESVLGAPLFERTSNGMRPTPYAEPFLEHARAALSHVRQAARHVQELADGEEGVVTVGVHLAGANLLLPRAIGSLKRSRPHVDVVVHEGAPDVLIAQLAAGDIDVLITRLTPGVSHLVEELHHDLLQEEPVAIVCGVDTGPPMGPLQLAELAELSWVLPLQSTALRGELEAEFARAEVPLPSSTVECTSLVTVGSLVAEGGFIGVLPLSIAQSLPGVRLLEVQDMRLRSHIAAVRVADHRPSPVTSLLLTHLRRAAP